MDDIIVKEDIYDKNGVLLLAKGRTTSSTYEKLNRHNERFNKLMAKPEQIPSELRQKAQILGERINIANSSVLEETHNVLGNIIFESKQQGWWIVVNALANYVDWLYTHSLDVSMISIMLGIKLGYDKRQLWDLGLGAFLHDAGKLLVPKRIIKKREPLNELEVSCIMQHCELGVSSLEAFDLTKDCMDIVLKHHERMDGSGYPYGLTEEKINPNAKIVMIADTIDAITSSRPYREARSLKTAIEILNKNQYKYPRDLVDMFISMI